MLGTRLGSSVSESETREHGRSRPALPLQKGAGAHPARGSRDPPCLSLTRGCTCALPGGQGRAHILLGGLVETGCSWEKRERGGGRRRAFQSKPECNGVTKISLDRRDIMLLSTIRRRLGTGSFLRKPWLGACRSPRMLTTAAVGAFRFR